MTTTEERSRIMRAVRSKDTGPEMVVRRLLHALGYRFRLHRDDLPGRPDIVFPSRRAAIFVHGCFWHGHDCKRGNRTPKSNAEYWKSKISRNVARDQRVAAALESVGWRSAIVWECELKNPADALARLGSFLGAAGPGSGRFASPIDYTMRAERSDR